MRKISPNHIYWMWYELSLTYLQGLSSSTGHKSLTQKVSHPLLQPSLLASSYLPLGRSLTVCAHSFLYSVSGTQCIKITIEPLSSEDSALHICVVHVTRGSCSINIFSMNKRQSWVESWSPVSYNQKKLVVRSSHLQSTCFIYVISFNAQQSCGEGIFSPSLCNYLLSVS